MIKKLLFEGCGWSGTESDSDIGNCKLRTAFHDDNGRPILLEICGNAKKFLTDKSLASRYGDFVGFVDKAYYIKITDSLIDLWFGEREKAIDDDKKIFKWTRSGIIELLKQLNTTVEKIEIDNSHTYRVYTEDDNLYCYGDSFNIQK